MNQGRLYLVSGPIGNFNDITLRAIDILKSSDIILSEDTRETSKLLNNLNIKAEQISYRDQNHERIIDTVLGLLEEGKVLSLVSDSGTPVISDPGFKLVRELKNKNINVVPVPGPTAAMTAISASGLPTDRFVFLGFLPKTSGRRQNLLKIYGDLDNTLIIYESPYRIVKLLEEILETLGDRKVCLARELTKIHEEIVTDKVSILLEKTKNRSPKGEFVVMVSKED